VRPSLAVARLRAARVIDFTDRGPARHRWRS
jgi:hypothetical protein